MQTITITLPNQKWRGIKTKWPVDMIQVGPDDFLTGSQNFDTDVNGVITKRPGGIAYDAVDPDGAAKDLYEAIFTDGTHHLLKMAGGKLKYSSGGGSFTTVTSGYSASGNMEFTLYQNRVYFDNGIDTPQVYDKTASYGGVSYTVPKTKDMGCQVPTAPSASLVSDSTTNQVPAGAHTYQVTYLYYDDEESNGSPTSNLVTNDGSHTKTTVTIPVGGYGVTARKIYRDNNDGSWLLVGVVSDNTTTSFTDKSQIGTSPVPVNNGLPPTFSQIVTFLDRNFVAGVPGSPSVIYFSQPGSPDLFDPTAGFVLCNPKDPIIGLVVYNNRIIILNRNSLGQILGNQTSNFSYATIPSSVGCVDNRSIQIRTIRGVPVLMWLSDKGFYQYNGQSVDYISEDIENEVNLNIQQASQVKGRDAQDSESDFLGGTASPGIDLTDDPGFIMTKNPQRVWQSEADWEGGSSLTNCVTEDGSNTLKVPTIFAPNLSDGSFNTVEQSGSTLILPTGGTFTGESHSESSHIDHYNDAINTRWSMQMLAQSFLPPLTGVVNTVTLHAYWENQSASTITGSISIYSDVFGIPNAPIASGSFSHSGGLGANTNATFTVTVNASVTGGTQYWIVLTLDTDSGAQTITTGIPVTTDSWTSGGGCYAKLNPGAGSWTSQGVNMAGSYTFSVTASAESGQWTSPTWDTAAGSTVSSGLTFTVSGSYPTSTSATATVQGSVNSDFSTIDQAQTVNNPNGSTSLSISGVRYWRIVLTLSTTDNRATPTVGTPVLAFNNVAVWISEVLDLTTDVTAFNSLTITDTIPATTSVLLEIATSSDNVTYSSFGAFGSATAHRYAKVRITITGASDDSASPVVSSLNFIWTLTSNLISSAIDTGSTPAGWELFQSSFQTNGGTVAFYVRTAASSGALSSASFVSVTNGAFIGAAVNEFIQWKVVLTATAGNIPTVDSVTINWFISQVASIRVASIFYNRNYYMAAAEFGNDVNNIVFKYDQDNTWKIYRGLGINAFSFFFNDPYYASSDVGEEILFAFGKSQTDLGDPITMDVRVALKTGARLPNDMDDKIKILKEVNCRVKGTGGTYQFYFSLDQGNTWTLMIDPNSGLMNFPSPNDGNAYEVRMQPVFQDGQPTPAGRTILLRIVEDTTAGAEIRSLKARLWVRDKQKIVNSNA